MSEIRTILDPFLNKQVEISNRLTDRLRGKYANGPTTPNGEPEFGWREFQTPPIQHEAADEIERLRKALQLASDTLQDMISRGHIVVAPLACHYSEYPIGEDVMPTIAAALTSPERSVAGDGGER